MRMRRNIQAGLISILASLSSCSKPEPTEAEKYFTYFPVALKGAHEIQKYGVDGAKHCLVHIRQTHLTEPKFSLVESKNKSQAQEADILSRIESSEDQEEKIILGQDLLELRRLNEETRKIAYGTFISQLGYVAEVQRDILHMLGDLDREYFLGAVRDEGIDKTLSKVECKSVLRNGFKIFIDKGYITQEDALDPNKYFLAGGAARILGAAGRIEIRPTEDRTLNQAAFEAVKSHKLEDDTIFNQRENHVMRLVSEEPYSVTLFGANHNFRDNVENWNKQNPDNKFSLIVVTPNSLK